MKKHSILHLGDVHFGGLDQNYTPIDDKDKGVDPKILNQVRKPLVQKILKKILSELNDEVVAVIFSGDITTYGNESDFGAGIDFLKEHILLKIQEDQYKDKIFIVPGNHDVNRKLYSEKTTKQKFTPLEEIFKEKKMPPMPVDKPLVYEIPVGEEYKIGMVLLNSSIGCGERRYYPKPIADAIDILNKNEKISDEDKKIMGYEELDTPLIGENDLEECYEKILSMDQKTLPLILAHHNLLPQNIPRFSIYTEMINSGVVRNTLIKLNRPVIYCHGHIHDNPIEEIKSGNKRFQKSRIVSISAPLLFPNDKYSGRENKVGFNKINIYFGKNLPLGCEIVQYSINNAGEIEKNIQRVKLVEPHHAFFNASEEAMELFAKILTTDNSAGDILKRLEKEDGFVDIPKIEEQLDELSWFGLIQYSGEETYDIYARKLLRLVP